MPMQTMTFRASQVNFAAPRNNFGLGTGLRRWRQTLKATFQLVKSFLPSLYYWRLCVMELFQT